MPNLADILDKEVADIKPPIPYPAGTYLVKTLGVPRYDHTSPRDDKEPTPFYEFTYVFEAAMDDVNKAELAEIEGGIVGKQMKERYWLTDAALFRLKRLLEHCGFNTDEKGVTIRQMAEASAGSQIYVTLRQRPNNDGKTIRSEVASTAAVD